MSWKLEKNLEGLQHISKPKKAINCLSLSLSNTKLKKPKDNNNIQHNQMTITTCNKRRATTFNDSSKPRKKSDIQQPKKKRALTTTTKGVCHIVALPFTFLKSILRQKKNYGKLKYFTMQKYNLQKIIIKNLLKIKIEK